MVFWLLFHRIEANDDTFYVTGWLVQMLKAIQIPHMGMAYRAWCPRMKVSHFFYFLSTSSFLHVYLVMGGRKQKQGKLSS